MFLYTSARFNLKMKSYGKVLVLLYLSIAVLNITARVINRDDMGNPADGQSQWCRSITFNQTISRKNCKERHIINKMCYGECFSYYFPGSWRKKAAFFACRPSQLEQKTLLLDCLEGSTRKIHVASVQLIRECSCMLIDFKISDIIKGPL